MRTAFMNRLCELGRQDERICLIVGDLGFSVVEPFIKEFPLRFLNAGVAEQSMTGIAVGWSLAENKIVFIYSLGNFPTMRCLEQIRNDCCAHKANVKIISLGSGITYGQSGYSHFAVEDLAVMGAMPNMTIFTPADLSEAKRCLDLSVSISGPAYFRLAKNGEPKLNEKPGSFDIGDFVEYKSGKDICIIGVGTILFECLRAADLLGKDITAEVIGLPVFKPLNETKLVDLLRRFSFIATVEEHSAYGGLASVIGEIISRNGLNAKLLKFALPEGFNKTGFQSDLLKLCGLESTQIASRIKTVVSKMRKVI
jgi:transketolase